MNLNLDCARDILLEIEKVPQGEEIYIGKIINSLPKYSEDEIRYAALKLAEAEYISAFTLELDGASPSVQMIYDITFEGHTFLNNVRPLPVWEQTKKAVAKVGTHALPIVGQIASGLAIELIKGSI